MELLRGMKVTVASHGVAAAYAGWLLRQYGADVDHASALDPEGLGAYLAEGASFVASPELPAGGSLLITDAPVTAENRAWLEEAAAAGRAVIWITPWGLDNPWQERPWTDLSLHAAGGWMHAVGEIEREPLGPPGAQGQFAAGLYATIHALATGDTAGLSVVSMIESVTATTIYDAVTFQYIGAVRERSGNRFARAQVTLMTLPCKDGWVGVHAALHHQFVKLCALVGHPELVTDSRFERLMDRIANTAELDPYFIEWTSQHDRFEAYHLLQAARIPSSPLPTMGEVLDSPQLAARDAWAEVQTPSGTSYRVPGPPVRVVAEAAANGSARKDGPWAPGKLRVVDFSMGWAGPMVSYILASYGADVIKLESHTRFDWWRGSRPPADNPEQPLHEMTPTYNSANRGKRDLTLDLGTEDGHRLALELFATADIVVENYAAGVLEKLGLDYATISKENPGLILIRQPGFGSSGPESGYVVFGNTIEGMSGITTMIGYDDATYPFQMSNACGDPISGLNGTVAALAAVRARAHDGRGRCIEAAQIEGFLPLMSSHLIDYQRTGRQRPRQANRRDGALFSGVFASAGENRWLAVEVRSEAQLEALRAVTGGGVAEFAAWAACNERDLAAAQLAAAGIPAAPVYGEPDMLSNEPFASTAFYQGVDRVHVGYHVYPALPVVSGGERPTPATCAPTLGEHNAEILAGLGLTPEAISDLERRSVIGSYPV